MRSPVRIWVAAPDNPGALTSIGALAFFRAFFVSCYPVLTGKDTAPAESLILKSPPDSSQFESIAAQDSRSAQQCIGALAFIRAFSKRFSYTQEGLFWSCYPMRTGLSSEARNPVRILGAECVKLACKQQAERIFAKANTWVTSYSSCFRLSFSGKHAY